MGRRSDPENGNTQGATVTTKPPGIGGFLKNKQFLAKWKK
jgi:hypothetical protein